jgi:uncharacterized membrane protein
MRRLTVFAFAAALCLALSVPSALAASATSQTVDIKLTGTLPDTVRAGSVLRASFLLENLTDAYLGTNLQIQLVTPLGDLPVRTQLRTLAPHANKTIKTTFTVDADARPGPYTLVVSAVANNRTATIRLPLTITR